MGPTMKIWKKSILIPTFVFFLLLIRFVSQIGLDRTPHERFRVIGIIDGDTVELTGGDRLRLTGIDCPEKGELYYDEAKALLGEIALGRTAEVTYSKRRRDGYGRLLGYMYLDSLFVNVELVRKGLAYVYLHKDNLGDTRRIEALLSAQNEAIDGRVGLWSVEHEEEPYYLAKKQSFRLHRPSCASVRDLGPGEYIRFDSRLAAFRQGYSPCRNCKP